MKYVARLILAGMVSAVLYLLSTLEMDLKSDEQGSFLDTLFFGSADAQASALQCLLWLAIFVAVVMTALLVIGKIVEVLWKRAEL